jgi:serine/threonine protein kinase/WD40 repeat protein
VGSVYAGIREGVLVDLVSEHLHRSWKTGACLTLNDYVAEFGRECAELASNQKMPADLVEQEFTARHEFPPYSDYPTIELYRQRFPGRQDVLEQLEARHLDNGRYVKIRLQGQGGLGLVWLAYDRHLKRYVAIKEPNPALPAERVALARLADEARITAGLEHPAIVAVHELRQADGELPYYVMRLVSGPTMRAVIDDYHRNRAGRNATSQRVLWRKLLQAFTTVCDAIAYAHSHGVMHCDLKPHNVILGDYGETVVLDWGLAKMPTQLPAMQGKGSMLRVPQECGPEADDITRGQPGHPASSTPIEGTYSYMAPEAAGGIYDTQSDIFCLGAILYEILMGRPPYENEPNEHTKMFRTRVQEARYPLPKTGISGGQALEAICLKAMAYQPKNRYLGALELAEDVRRWLADEPVSCYRESLSERLGRVARRRRMWVVATVVVFGSLLVALAVLGFLSAALSNSREKLAESRQAEAEAHEKAVRRELLTDRITHQRLTPHRDGWFQEITALAREAAGIRKDLDLRNKFTGAFAGLDARALPGLNTEAASIRFSKDGKRMLIDGYTNIEGQAREPAKVWEGGIDKPRNSEERGTGAIAFRAVDNAALQLVPDPRDWFTLRLWNIDKQQLVREFKLADKPSPNDWHQRNAITLELSPDGSLAAASTLDLDSGSGRLAVWDVLTGKAIRSIESGFRALAFSPDGALLAAGDKQGRVRLWSRNQEKERTILPVGRTEIRCLAFGRHPLRRVSTNPEEAWLLAAGEAGSEIAIWDLQRKQRRIFCRGSSYHVNAVAFSPDGTLLASAGRYETKLWDAFTGQLLLNLVGSPRRNWLTGVAFSPDGMKLAVTSQATFGPGGVDVWQLEYGRGIQTLYGLANRVAQIAVPTNAELIAGLDDSWNVAIWDQPSGRLLRVLEVPPGYYTDNVFLAFSPNGDLLAFSSATVANLWEVATGKEKGSWRLPPGMSNKLAFDSSGQRLLLVRVETDKRELPPLDRVSWREHPRVVRAYDLLSSHADRPFVEITEFKPDAWIPAIAPDASYFVVGGLPDEVDLLSRTIRVLDGTCGTKELLTFHAKGNMPEHKSVASVDATGSYLVLDVPSDGRWLSTLFDMPSGKMIRPVFRGLPAKGLELSLDGTSICREEQETPMVTLDLDGMISSHPRFLYARGTHVAWGNRNGTVTVCDLARIQENLAAIGLQW